MKKLIFLLTLTAFYSSAFAEKIGTIDMDKTFLKYYKTINAEKRLKKQVRIMEDRAVEMDKRHKKIIGEYEKLVAESASVLLSEDARKQKKEDAESKGAEIRMIEKTMRSFNKDARGLLSKQHNQSRADILEEIKKVISMVSKNKGYDLVLDSSGKTSNLIPVIIYNKGSFDVTDEVLKVLNKGHEQEIADWEKEKAAKKAEKAKAAEKK
ncbi:MAG: OmpH family outer membrane protein [Lentisphaeraceae bacterium]|nr:OmpH family outer membrane protein [Lentisphaeraceae bacterium]